MEEDDDARLCRFGTPLEPLEEDEIPSKKPISVEDQIATDSNGRRRFHGAFTGGFSAGFWNTVGSLEGWKPQSFKSSRTEKADAMKQNPIDFMDDEDLGEFGIAPQRMQTTEEFTSQDSINLKSTNRKRKLQNTSVGGPIPGVPVLHHLLEPAKENVAIRLLKKMGWKLGQGIGARQTRKEKKAASERNARERYVMKKYGCDLGPIQVEHPEHDDDNDDDKDDDSDSLDEDITFAPDDFESYVCGIKDNTFGLGYSGLSRNSVLSKPQQHINLFEPFEDRGKDNKKLLIRGQAFGVGAMEEEDEDIYARDDMTKYDFSLEEIKKAAPKKESYKDARVIEGFHAAKVKSESQKKIFTIKIHNNFKPRNWAIRRSRFEPLNEQRVEMIKRQEEHKIKGLGRHDLDPDERGRILGESSVKKQEEEKASTKSTSERGKKKTYLERINEKYESSKLKQAEAMNLINSREDSFSKGEVISAEKDNVSKDLDENTRKENEKVQAEAKKITKSIADNKPGVFKPFINNEAKQERYDKFIEVNFKDDEEITKFLAPIQPLNMSEWEREMEKKEFLQAKRIYKPLKGLMSDRFVSESTVIAEKEAVQNSSDLQKKEVKITRTKVMWKPHAQLCKRFNVPEPFGGTMVEVKQQKKSRFSIFDYIEGSVNTKENFVTPIIIPTKMEKPKPIIIQQSVIEKEKECISNPFSISTKKLVTKEIEEAKSKVTKEITTPATDAIDDDKNKSETSSKESSKKTLKPKSTLEIKIEETKNRHPSEKKDLFKAIFEDSTEDEDDNNNDDDGGAGDGGDEDQSSKTKNNIKTSNIPPSIFHSLTKPSAELNILRNTSPPRGIFAYLFKQKADESKSSTDDKFVTTSSTIKIKKSPEMEDNKKKIISVNLLSSSSESDEKLSKERETEEDNIYGPKIPMKINPAISGGATVDKTSSTAKAAPSFSVHKDKVDDKIIKLLKKSKKSAEIIEKWVEKSDDGCKNNKKKKKEKHKKKKSKKHKKEKKSHKNKK